MNKRDPMKRPPIRGGRPGPMTGKDSQRKVGYYRHYCPYWPYWDYDYDYWDYDYDYWDYDNEYWDNDYISRRPVPPPKMPKTGNGHEQTDYTMYQIGFKDGWYAAMDFMQNWSSNSMSTGTEHNSDPMPSPMPPPPHMPPEPTLPTKPQ